jgi:Tol biopolymer transport system component
MMNPMKLLLAATLAALALPAAAGARAASPPILYVQGLACPAHQSCNGKPAYFDRIRKIARVGFPSSRVSSGVFSDSHPAWSPGHTRIAFIRTSRNGLTYTLWTMLANGTGQKQLTRGTAVAEEPSWSPDGKTIVLRSSSNGGRTFDLYTIPAAGGVARNVTRNAGGVGALNPDWSPNGKLIVFQRMKNGSGAGTGLYTIRPDGSGLRRLTIGGQDPAWSPNGKRIAAIFPDAKSGGRFEIYTLNANGTGRRRVTSGPEGTAPAWSPDGARIVFVRGSQIALVGAAGGRVKQITRPLHGLAFVDTPSW